MEMKVVNKQIAFVDIVKLSLKSVVLFANESSSVLEGYKLMNNETTWLDPSKG